MPPFADLSPIIRRIVEPIRERFRPQPPAPAPTPQAPQPSPAAPSPGTPAGPAPPAPAPIRAEDVLRRVVEPAETRSFEEVAREVIARSSPGGGGGGGQPGLTQMPGGGQPQPDSAAALANQQFLEAQARRGELAAPGVQPVPQPGAAPAPAIQAPGALESAAEFLRTGTLRGQETFLSQFADIIRRSPFGAGQEITDEDLIFAAAPIGAPLGMAGTKIAGWIPRLGRVISQGEVRALLGALKSGRASLPSLINRFGAENVRQAMLKNTDDAIRFAEQKSMSMLERLTLEGSTGLTTAAKGVGKSAAGTAGENIFKGWLGQFSRAALSPKLIATAAVGGAIGATIYGWSMTGNEAGDIGMAVGIASQLAVEAGDMEAVEQLRAYQEESERLLKSWQSVAPFVSIFTARRLEFIKGRIGLLQLELSQKAAEANAEKWDDIAEREEKIEADKRAYWENVTKQKKIDEAEAKAYWEKQQADKRAYDEAVRAYWAGVEAEKERRKAEDRAYWEGVEARREREAWNYGFSQLNFGLL